MILQELNAYAQRLGEEDKIAPPGFEPQKIGFEILLDAKGNLVKINDLREDGKKPRPTVMILPKAFKKSSGIVSQCCWENAQYIFGLDSKGKPERALECHQAFKDQHQRLAAEANTPILNALLSFLKNWQPLESMDQRSDLFYDPKAMAMANFVFRLDGQRQYLHEDPDVQSAWLKMLDAQEYETGVCLVTGETAPIEKIHPAIKGVPGAQSSGASLVSFNLDAFTSYGKSQNLNSPVSVTATENYAKALNYLLDFESRQKVSFSGVTYLFWSEQSSLVETGLVGMFQIEKKSKEDKGLNLDLEIFLDSVKQGKLPEAVDTESKFFILGLSPNAARISVRFWLVSSTGKIFEAVKQHFEDLKIIPSYPDDSPTPSMVALLLETAVRHEFKNR